MSTSTGTAIVTDTNNQTTTAAGAASASTNENIFARAGNYEPLTALERTLLKVIRYCLLAGLIAAIPIISQAFTTQSIDWSQVLKAALAAFGTAALLTLLKYLKARADELAGTTLPGGQAARSAQPNAPITQ